MMPPEAAFRRPLRVDDLETSVTEWLEYQFRPRRDVTRKESPMSKRARKRRSRKGKAANHGKKPNA